MEAKLRMKVKKLLEKELIDFVKIDAPRAAESILKQYYFFEHLDNSNEKITVNYPVILSGSIVRLIINKVKRGD